MMSSTLSALLSPSDIADLAKVNRPVVSNWRKRHTDFPPAVAGTEAKPLFSYDVVVEWLRQRGHSIEDAGAGRLVWSALNAISEKVSIEVGTDFFLLLATLKFANEVKFDKILVEHNEGQTTRLIEAAKVLSQAHGLDGNRELPEAVTQLQPSCSPVFDAVSQIGVNELADAADFVLERLARSQIKRGAESGFIASRTSALLASLVGQKVGTVYDPACGIANVLIHLSELGLADRIVGSDISHGALSIARQRSFLHRVNIEFLAGDVLDIDPVPDLRADIVVAEPPFGMHWDSSSKLMDPRFSFGVPPKSSSDLAWIQHAIAHLQARGRAYVLTSPASLSRSGAECKIRANLLSAGCLEAVVALPPKMLPHTAIGPALWVLRAGGEATDVLLIDASEHDAVEDHVASWLSQKSSQLNDSAVPHTFIPVAELLSADAVLTPKRWVGHVEIDKDAIASAFLHATETMQQTMQQIASTSLAFEQLKGLSKPRITTIRELIDNGIIELQAGRLGKTRKLDKIAEQRIARVADVKNRCLPPVRDLREFTHPDLTQVDDILVTTMDEVRAVVDKTGGHLPSAGVDRLRILDQSVVTANYLAVVIAGSWNARLQTGVTLQRAPIRDLEIPLISVGEQGKVDVTQGAVGVLREQSELLNAQARVVQNAILDAVRYDVGLEFGGEDEC